jgi:PQQ-like domain
MLPSLRQVLSITFLCAVALITVTAADVRVEPTFGHPYIFADRIVFASVDGRRLIGIDKQGHLHWEVAFPVRVFLQRSDDQLLVQSGAEVYRLNVSNGTRSEVLRMPKDESLIAEVGTNFLAAADKRFNHNHLRIINPVDHSTAWESSSIEEIVSVTSPTVVAVTADRKYEREQSYHLENGNLRGFDRKDGQIRWSMPLGADLGSVASAQVGVFLAVVDRLRTYDPVVGDTRLLILNPDTGAVLSKRDGKFTDLWPLEDSLAVLERGSGGAEAEFYVCKLPDCAKKNPISLSAREILRVRLYGEYIITAGIYDSACFERATGTRLWEKGQLEWSQPFDDEMVVTDFSPSDQTARIVAVELRSGHEQVLFSRKVTRHDKANFRPW